MCARACGSALACDDCWPSRLLFVDVQILHIIIVIINRKEFV